MRLMLHKFGLLRREMERLRERRRERKRGRYSEGKDERSGRERNFVIRFHSHFAQFIDHLFAILMVREH